MPKFSKQNVLLSLCLLGILFFGAKTAFAKNFVEPISSLNRTGFDLSLVLDQNNKPHVFFVDQNSGNLYAAVYVNGWQNKIIASQALGQTSAAFDEAGNLMVAFLKNDSVYSLVSVDNGATFSEPMEAVSGARGEKVSKQKLVFDSLHQRIYLVFTQYDPVMGKSLLKWRYGVLAQGQIIWLSSGLESNSNVTSFAAALRRAGGTIGVVYYSNDRRTLYYSENIEPGSNNYVNVFPFKPAGDTAGEDPSLAFNAAEVPYLVTRYEESNGHRSLKLVNQTGGSWNYENLDPVSGLTNYDRGFRNILVLDEKNGAQKIVTYSADEQKVKLITRSNSGEITNEDLFSPLTSNAVFAYAADSERSLEHLAFQDSANLNAAYLVVDRTNPELILEGSPNETVVYSNTNLKPIFFLSGLDNSNRELVYEVKVNGAVVKQEVSPTKAVLDSQSLVVGENQVEFKVIDKARNSSSKIYNLRYNYVNPVTPTTPSVDSAPTTTANTQAGTANDSNNSNFSGSGQGKYLCGKDKLPQSKIDEKALALRKELTGAAITLSKVGVTEKNWGEYVNLYAYCDYPVDALLKRKFFPKVIDPNTNWKVYRKGTGYQQNIFKTIPNQNLYLSKNYLSYYAEQRLTLEQEKFAASLLRQNLQNKYGLKKLNITALNWARVVNAYLYGGYSVDDVARVFRFAGKVVHPWMPKYLFKTSFDYRVYSVKSID